MAPAQPPAHAPVPAQPPAPARPFAAYDEPDEDRFLARGLARVTGEAVAPYQTAVVRIGFALTWLFFLLREFPHRHELYGPDGPWSWRLAERLIDTNHAFTVLMWSDSAAWFEFVYLLAIAASLAVILGWRTRTATVIYMVGVLGLQNRSVFMGDGGDNVIHLMAMYVVLTRCAEVWSLDARRRRRAARAGSGSGGRSVKGASADVTGVVLWSVFGAVMLLATVGGSLSIGWGLFFWALWAAQAAWWLVNRYLPGSEARAVCDMVANLAHNATLLVIVVEVCLIYSTAGWYKIQGSRWQDGTAVYYPMNLDYFSPWPGLSSFLAGSGLLILLATYGTVMVQVAFPFTLFNRRVKNALLAAMIAEHLSIAVLLGLPFFSMAMIAADAVFLPTVALVWLGARFDGGRRRVLARVRPGRAQGAYGGGGHGPGSGSGGSGGGPDDGGDGGGSSPVPQQRSGDGLSVR
ncbi:HTTM domain-containing protein [Streptomyces nanshensis]|uniref:HTTM domain-containing protein n=1 Tax=Streptomyces nanshensis TaxID=518642 RepID=UPI00085C8676|nr:HTTM domain-containing protein [Streptomyces nanshensis]